MVAAISHECLGFILSLRTSARPSYLRRAAGRAAPLSREGGGIHLDVSETGSRQPALPAGPPPPAGPPWGLAPHLAAPKLPAKPAGVNLHAGRRTPKAGRSLGRPNRQPPQQLTSAGSSLTLLPGQGASASASAAARPLRRGATAGRGKGRQGRWGMQSRKGGLSEEDGDALSDGGVRYPRRTATRCPMPRISSSSSTE
jgi:hypothetical protein